MMIHHRGAFYLQRFPLNFAQWPHKILNRKLFQNIHLARPSKNDFVKFNKKVTVLLNFLDQTRNIDITPKTLQDFKQRCENGLQVEKDVYITKEELYQNMWENGYSDLELRQLSTFFPNTYRFHYPELAVLFDLNEEDCYKYCLRTRGRAAIESNELIELKDETKKLPYIRYGIVTVLLWMSTRSHVLSNAWFMVKTWPFLAVFYMIYTKFQKQIAQKIEAADQEDIKIAQINREKGEAQLFKQLQSFKKDLDYLNALHNFRPAIEKHVKHYKLALLIQHSSHLVQSVQNYIDDIAIKRRGIQTAVQAANVSDAIQKVETIVKQDPQMKEAFLNTVTDALENNATTLSENPLQKLLKKTLKEFEADTPDSKITFKKSYDLTAHLEQEFIDQFCFTFKEIAFFKNLYKLYGYKVELFTPQERLEALKVQRNIFTRLKLTCLIPQINTKPIQVEEPDAYVREINLRMTNLRDKLNHAYLRRLMRAVNESKR